MVPYNSGDTIITTFLKGIALGESGGLSYASTEYLGVGGGDLSNYPVNAFGFPVWSGHGNPVSHACGPFQFEPATWNGLAEQNHLYFGNLGDQCKGAWILAEQVFFAKTKGGLYNALKARQFLTVQGALSQTWTSVTGNRASPGLAKYLTANLKVE